MEALFLKFENFPTVDLIRSYHLFPQLCLSNFLKIRALASNKSYNEFLIILPDLKN